MPVQVQDIIPEDAAQEQAPPQEEAQKEVQEGKPLRRRSAEADLPGARTSRSRQRGKWRT